MADCAEALTPAPRSQPHFVQIAARKSENLRRRDNIRVLLIGDSLIARWPRDLLPKQSFNFGVGGDRTQNVLWRVREAKLPHVDSAVILAGTNNLRSDEADCIAEAVSTIAHETAERSEARKTIVIGILPRRANARIAEKIAAINSRVAAAAGPYRFLDLTASFKDPSLYGPDGLHLSRPGYETLSRAVAAALQK